MKNLNIIMKFMVGFGVFLLCLIAVSVYTSYQFKFVFDKSKEAVFDTPVQVAFVDIQFKATQGHLNFEEWIAGDKSQSIDSIYRYWDECIEYCNVLLDRGSKDGIEYRKVTDSLLRKSIEDIKESLSDMMLNGQGRITNMKTASAGERADQEFDAAYQKVIQNCNFGKDRAWEISKNSFSVMNLTYDTSQNRVIVAILIITIIALTTLWFLAKTVSEPIVEVSQRLKNADLNLVFNYDRKDEIGSLTRAFDNFVITIKSTLTETLDASKEVASSSSQILMSTGSMAKSTQEQLGEATSITTAVDEMSKTGFEIASHTMTTKESAIEVQKEVNEGITQMEEASQNIERMAKLAQSSVESVHSLDESSQKISTIVIVLEDITRQINLIAVNSSIAAARAGEKGKGFAVVADEIKKLAEKANLSTMEINSVIKKIQSDIGSSIGLMQANQREAKLSLPVIKTTREKLNTIAANFGQMANMVSQIAVSSQEQSVTSDQIAQNVKNFNTATQTIASGIQQIADSAQNLNKLTTSLQSKMTRFNLNS